MLTLACVPACKYEFEYMRMRICMHMYVYKEVRIVLDLMRICICNVFGSARMRICICMLYRRFESLCFVIPYTYVYVYVRFS